MAPKNCEPAKREMSRGAWTPNEDRKLEQHIELHGAKRWKTIAAKSGLNRCGKSCRLRWLNYLRPNIKRGNISSDEEDMIIRLHKLLGNRWSLIAGRLPGRTDNEIKNYWNSHVSKKTIQNNINNEDIFKTTTPAALPSCTKEINDEHENRALPENKVHAVGAEGCNLQGDLVFDVNEFLNFSFEGCYGLELFNKFLQLDDEQKLVEKHKDSSKLQETPVEGCHCARSNLFS